MSITIRTKNFLSSIFFLCIAYMLYTKLPYYRNYFGGSYNFPFLKASIRTLEAFSWVFALYAAFLFLIFFLEKNPKVGKGVNALRALKKIFSHPLDSFEKGIPRDEKIALLAILLKIFFTPLLISWLLSNSSKFFSEGGSLIHSSFLSGGFILLFREHLFLMLFNLILLVDVLFFSFGYLVELDLFKNKIISVDPTLLGWVFTLICYPPFNNYASYALLWKSTDFPYFANPYLFLTLNISILLLMGIYSWASVSLGAKASNLTHRGIVACGPYRFVRHPAYACKNAAWWLGGVPFIISAVKAGIIPVFLVIFSLTSWTMVYSIRAVTEEEHLMSVNDEYKEYIKKVPYRFMPFII